MPIFTVENLTRRRILAGRVQATRTSRERRRGLLQTRVLETDFGLWINPCEAIHTFGMQLDLDAVFLDRHCRIRKISANLRPNRIAICLTAASVLEIKAGLALASGTECGDQLVFRRCSEPTGLADANR